MIVVSGNCTNGFTWGGMLYLVRRVTRHRAGHKRGAPGAYPRWSPVRHANMSVSALRCGRTRKKFPLLCSPPPLPPLPEGLGGGRGIEKGYGHYLGGGRTRTREQCRRLESTSHPLYHLSYGDTPDGSRSFSASPDRRAGQPA